MTAILFLSGTPLVQYAGLNQSVWSFGGFQVVMFSVITLINVQTQLNGRESEPNHRKE